jgi:periplasmic divalent cation tolerance protein
MHIVVFVTAGSKDEACKIARRLIEKRLAACVNIVEKIDSLFRWEGKVDAAAEALLLIKSKKSKFSQIVKAVRSVHSYEVPEIIALPIICGDGPYLKWIDASVR